RRGRYLYVGVGDWLFRVPNNRWIDADGGDARNLAIVMRLDRFLAERGDFARRVLALERRERDHRGGCFTAPEFRTLLDRARGIFGHALFDSDLVDRADFIKK